MQSRSYFLEAQFLIRFEALAKVKQPLVRDFIFKWIVLEKAQLIKSVQHGMSLKDNVVFW